MNHVTMLDEHGDIQDGGQGSENVQAVGMQRRSLKLLTYSLRLKHAN